MSDESEQPPTLVAFCPYCGEPLGSFFGSRLVDGARVCDRCGECFRVIRVADSGDN
jgi:hypothetical protein